MAWRLGRTGAVVLAAGWLLGTAAAQDSPIDRAKALRQVADQKAEADFKGRLAEAEKLARVDPAKAARRVKEAIRGLDLSVEISSEKRVELVKLAETSLAVIEGKALPDPAARQKKDDLQKLEEAARLEVKEIREGVTAIERLHVLNRTPEANKKVAELAQKYPNNPSVLVLTGQMVTGEKIAMARELAREQAEGFVLALNSVQEAAIPPRGDIVFPKDWKEKTERRRKMFEVKLSPEEESILQALEKKVGQTLKDSPFEETVQQLSTLIDKPIYLDKKSLEEAGLDMRRPVTMPGGVTARTALRAILQSQGLTYIVKDKVIQVVTLERAKETLVTRAYYLGDVISLSGPFGGAVTWGPVIDFQSTMQNAKLIIDSITASIDPLIWSTPTNRGPASVIFHAPSMSLIVRAPAEVHATLGSKLR
ncbi:MAG TPA: hypothetical protein VM533_12145 [Fimbriiglobus sp.]|jgi:hypothetical protein|nr:hypothetical protein [Fimbriiglobus sp.]